MNRRIFLIVLDSVGIGYAPDAADFGDIGSNTLASVVRSSFFNAPNLARLGLFNIEGVQCGPHETLPAGSFGRLREVSKGKDTTVGHWEISGLISVDPLPTYPTGFPAEVLAEFSRRTGHNVICNEPMSGTEAIAEYGQQHVASGDLIVYTSADSVFQVAAHESIVPLEQLYHYCKIAREILTGPHGVGRVIARPFTGDDPNFVRTTNRHDYSLVPSKDTMLDILGQHGYDTISVGKIFDIFAGKGITRSLPTKGNTDGINKTLELQSEDFNGLCFVNLVDFDMIYGHRNDIDGYAKAITEFDTALGVFMDRMRAEDIVMITADHGCDPGFKGTDHTREYVPLLAYGQSIQPGVNLGTRQSFADIGATILDMFDIRETVDGESFKGLIER
jgi:phosphopentomutase